MSQQNLELPDAIDNAAGVGLRVQNDLNDEAWTTFMTKINTEAQGAILEGQLKLQGIDVAHRKKAEPRVKALPLLPTIRNQMTFANKKYIKFLQRSNRTRWRQTAFVDQKKRKEGKQLYHIDELKSTAVEGPSDLAKVEKDAMKAYLMASTSNPAFMEDMFGKTVTSRKYLTSRGFSEVILGMKKKQRKRFKKFKKGKFKTRSFKRHNFKKRRGKKFGRRRSRKGRKPKYLRKHKRFLKKHRRR